MRYLTMTPGLYITAAAATAGVLAGAYCAYHLYKETKKHKLPTTWKKVGTLEDIFVYPIKSCGLIQKNTAECTFLGLKDGWLRDRTLMVVDEKNNFVTARTFPGLLLVKPTIKNSILTLTCKDIEPLNLNLEEITGTQLTQVVRMWGIRYTVYECGWEANEWFSRLLVNSSTGYRLVLFKESKNKMINFEKSNTRVFADELPFNLTNKASIDDLNTRLKVQVSHKHFRPNFLISGVKPYEEDNWKFVKIGETIFEVVKPCVRCIMTTNNPDTGVRNSNVEPLVTLKRYRQITDPEFRKYSGSSPRFGLQMVLRSDKGGRVSVDDPIFISI